MDTIIRLLDRVNAGIKFLEEKTTALLLTAICTVTAIGVIARYIFRNPLPWPNELAMFLFLWVAFLGASLVGREDGHYRIGFFFDKLPVRAQRIIEVITNLLKISFLVLFIVVSFRVLPRQAQRQMTAAVDINKAWHTASLTVGYIFLALFTFTEFMKSLRKLLAKGDQS